MAFSQKRCPGAALTGERDRWVLLSLHPPASTLPAVPGTEQPPEEAQVAPGGEDVDDFDQGRLDKWLTELAAMQDSGEAMLLKLGLKNKNILGQDGGYDADWNKKTFRDYCETQLEKSKTIRHLPNYIPNWHRHNRGELLDFKIDLAKEMYEQIVNWCMLQHDLFGIK